MRKAILSTVAIFIFASSAFVSQALAGPPDPTKDSDWKLKDSGEVVFTVDGGHGESWNLSLQVKMVVKAYINDTTKEIAEVLEYKDEPVAMHYYNDKNEMVAAVRVSDRWFASNKSGGDETVVSIVWGSGNKPVGLKFSLVTTAGPKERLISIK